MIYITKIFELSLRKYNPMYQNHLLRMQQTHSNYLGKAIKNEITNYSLLPVHFLYKASNKKRNSLYTDENLSQNSFYL